MAVDFMCYAVVALAVVMLTGTRHLSASSPVAWTAVILAVLVALGQSRRDHFYYPFDHWGMYASTTVPERVPKHLVRTRTGSVYEYPFVEVVFSSPRAFMAKIEQLIAACACRNGDARVDELLGTLALIHGRNHGVAVEAFWIEEVRLADGHRVVEYSWPSVSGQD
jgi:hypothetical protein